jgi:hypothetical protein
MSVILPLMDPNFVGDGVRAQEEGPDDIGVIVEMLQHPNKKKVN